MDAVCPTAGSSANTTRVMGPSSLTMRSVKPRKPSIVRVPSLGTPRSIICVNTAAPTDGVAKTRARRNDGTR